MSVTAEIITIKLIVKLRFKDAVNYSLRKNEKLK